MYHHHHSTPPNIMFDARHLPWQAAPADTTYDATYDATSSGDSRELINVPDDAALEEFRANVRTWLELDGVIKRLQAAAKEHKRARKEMTDKVLSFMTMYNVEDLNTRDGRLRYRVSAVASPLGHKKIKERLQGFIEKKFGADASEVQKEVDQTIFTRERVEKPSLRRLKAVLA